MGRDGDEEHRNAKRENKGCNSRCRLLLLQGIWDVNVIQNHTDRKMPINFDWLDSRYSSVFDKILLRDLNEIIRMILQTINDYWRFEMRSEIELLFKASKTSFGLKDLHIYYRDLAIQVTMCLYVGSLFMQFCMENAKADVIIEHLRRRRL